MPPLYIRPESLSPLDLSLVLLSFPTEISKRYPCTLLISHHSGPRGPRDFLLFYCPIITSLLGPPGCLTWPPVESYYPKGTYLIFLHFLTLWRFSWDGSRCQSPQRKVGALEARMGQPFSNCLAVAV